MTVFTHYRDIDKDMKKNSSIAFTEISFRQPLYINGSVYRAYIVPQLHQIKKWDAIFSEKASQLYRG